MNTQSSQGMGEILNKTEDGINMYSFSQGSYLPHEYSAYSLQPDNMPEPSIASGSYSSRVHITQKLKPGQSSAKKSSDGQSVSSKKLRTIHSTERLYYRDSINRMLKRNQMLEQKQENERKLIQNMRPQLSKGTREIIQKSKE